VSARKKKRTSGAHVAPRFLLSLENAAQKDRWQAAADRARRNLSDWIRCALDDAVVQQKRDT